MEKLRLVHGPEVGLELQQSGVQVHRYVLNMPGLYLMVAIALAAYLTCGVLWFGGFLGELWLKGIFALALVLGIVASLVVSYWKGFGEKRFIAVSPDYLMIGEDATRAWLVAWELLDLQKLGLTDMHVSKAGGRLKIDVAGQTIPVVLFSPFAYLEDPQSFMHEVLTRLGNDEQTSAPNGDDAE